MAWLACQGVLVGLLLAGMLLFRSRASLDFIYFQLCEPELEAWRMSPTQLQHRRTETTGN